ncbi:MAG TPA: outer membrane beta-barrel protein [Bryobacteraceae bacterium]|nr:outer membrane beta-barrel protein [Bryobacteraceae bacterium]
MLTKGLAVVLLAAGASSAGVFSFGLKTGVPINSALTSASSQFSVNTHRYTLGPTVELQLPHNFAFEADLLYKRLEYRHSPQGSGPQAAIAAVNASRWELPVLLKYKFRGAAFHPFVDLGGSFNRVVHIEGMNVAELRHRHTRGLVIGGGAERRFGEFRLAPEVRLTRWADRNFGVFDAPLRSNLTQAEFLIGFEF